MSYSSSYIDELRARRAGLISKAQALIPRDRTHGLTAQASAEFDLIMAQVDSLQDEITRSQPGPSHVRAVRIFDALANQPAMSDDEPSARVRAFHNFLKVGIQGLSADDRELMTRQNRHEDLGMIKAAQGVGTGAGGGFAVPNEAMQPLVEAMKLTGGLLAHATIVPSDTGADLPIPTDDETAVQGEIITENTVHNEADIALNQVVLKSFLYSSKIVRVSIQLMDDAGFDFGVYVMRRLGERIGRITAAHWANGTGTAQPRGLVTAATVGKIAASPTAVTYDELVDAMHSVDPLYRINGQWVMNDVTFSAIRKLKDSQNRPLYGDLNVNAPTTLLGKPVVIDPNVPSMAAATKAILFGDLATYHIRMVKGPRVLRLEERYADFAQLGFLAFLRADGNLIDGGGGSVKALRMA
jgi:HK97 family phage major capsid protein